MKLTLTSLLLGAVLLAPAATAVAQNPIDDYRRNGTINPCKYSDGQLRKGLGNLPPDVEQYAPGLSDSLNAGRQGCGGGAPGAAETRQTEAVPGPGSAGGWAPARGGSGPGGTAGIKAPPSPFVGERRRLANVAVPAVSSQPGQDVPGWVLPVLLAALAGAPPWWAPCGSPGRTPRG